MMTELNLEVWQYLILFPLLLTLIVYLWQVESHSDIPDEPYSAFNNELRPNSEE